MAFGDKTNYQVNVNRATHLETCLMAIFTLIFGAIYFLFQNIDYCSLKDFSLAVIVLTPLIFLYLHVFLLATSFVFNVLIHEQALEGISFSSAWSRYKKQLKISLVCLHLTPLVAALLAMTAFAVFSNNQFLKISATVTAIIYFVIYCLYWFKPIRKIIKMFKTSEEEIIGKLGIIYDQIAMHFSFYRELLDMFVEKTKEGTPHKVAEIGCGTGRLAMELAKESAIEEIWCIDKNENMVSMFEEKRKGMSDEEKNKITIKCGDATKTGLPPAEYDVVNAMNSIYLFDDPGKGIREVYRILKPGGRFNMSGPSIHDLELLEDRLITDLKTNVKDPKKTLGISMSLVKKRIEQAIAINKLLLSKATLYKEKDLRVLLEENFGFTDFEFKKIYNGTGYFVSVRKKEKRCNANP